MIVSARTLRITVGSALFALVGCSNGESNEVGGTVAELASAQAAIDDTADSEQTARADAEGCFETYRTCKETAGADVKTCRASLKSCLPDLAPEPRRCSADAGTRGSASVDAGSADGDSDSDESNEESTAIDGGRGHARSKGRDEHESSGKHCGRPDVSRDRLGACRDDSMATASSDDEASTAHAACVHAAFGDRISMLCTRATELCKRSDADADICARIADACETLSSAAQN